MPSNRRLIGIIIIIVGLAIIAAISYFAFWRQAPTDGTGDQNAPAVTGQLPEGAVEMATTTTSDKPRNPQQYDISKEPVHRFGAGDLEKLAMSFSERLGSYSSQSDYSNLTDLKLYMTESLQTWALQYADQLRDSRQNGSYYGISTTAVYANVKKFDEAAGVAEATVVTERRESTEKINGGETFRQDINLNFKKVNGEWLVDSAYWVK